MSVASVKTHGLIGKARLILQNGARYGWVTTFAFLAFVLAAALSVSAQEKCLQPGKLALIRNQISKGEKPEENLKLHDELLSAGKEFAAINRKATIDSRDDKKVDEEYQALQNANTSRICSILNSTGWPARSAVGTDGVDSFLFLISKAMPISMQLEVYPAVVDAFRKGEIDAGELMAGYVDRLRLAIGQKQLFGTQVYLRGGFLVMAPIDGPSKVDDRRREFKMQPIRNYERFLEISYRMPLIRAVMEPVGSDAANLANTANASLTSPASADNADEKPVVNIETTFVSVDVVIPDALDQKAALLEKSDFRVFEDDKPVEVLSFSKAETPFDIVLLLDLSGSTADQVGLIRKTTKRFVEMKRPNDRVAVVSFHDTQAVVSELESNKDVLLERIKKIEGRGASRIWDALKFGLDMLDKNSDKGRRKAIVLMSDGADNSLTYYSRIGSRIGFADLVERVQRSSAAIFPIYLDTEGKDPGAKKVYADARLTLNYLADQSAGNMYYAKKIDDLSTVYDRVLKDVGTVYSLGFSPDDETGESKWRTLRVEIPSHPGLKIKYRPGYFVK